MELVFVLVVVAVYVVLFVVRSLSSKAADVKGTPVLGDSFPVIEVYNERREGYKGNEHVQATVSKRKQQAMTTAMSNAISSGALEFTVDGVTYRRKSKRSKTFDRVYS